MARDKITRIPAPHRFPHPRGDGPVLQRFRHLFNAISPPAWGWPVEIMNKPSHPVDFPTRVGMAREASFAFSSAV